MRQETFRIEKIGGEGVGIGRIDGKVVFVPFTVPGDLISAEIVADTKSYSRGVLSEVIEPSCARVTPPCPVFGYCGGCSFQHIAYENQCEYKQTLISEIFRHYPEKGCAIERIVRCDLEYGYRNKLSLKCEARGGSLVCGFFAHKSHTLVETETCLLASKEMQALPGTIASLLNERAFDSGPIDPHLSDIAEIVVHSSNESKKMTVTFVTTGEGFRKQGELVRKIVSGIPSIAGIFGLKVRTQNVNSRADRSDEFEELPHHGLRKLYGDGIAEKLSGVTLALSPQTFFQVNQHVAEKLITRIRSILSASGAKHRLLVDLYSGIGTLSLPVADLFERVIAIESDEASCDLARQNAIANGFANYEVICADAGKGLAAIGRDYAKMPGAGQTLLLDPPRQGLGNEAIAILRDAYFERVIYLSCNPYTQARDMDKITGTGKYRLLSIAPFDMFPQTFHIESLAVLERA